MCVETVTPLPLAITASVFAKHVGRLSHNLMRPDHFITMLVTISHPCRRRRRAGFGRLCGLENGGWSTISGGKGELVFTVVKKQPVAYLPNYMGAGAEKQTRGRLRWWERLAACLQVARNRSANNLYDVCTVHRWHSYVRWPMLMWRKTFWWFCVYARTHDVHRHHLRPSNIIIS